MPELIIQIMDESQLIIFILIIFGWFSFSAQIFQSGDAEVEPHIAYHEPTNDDPLCWRCVTCRRRFREKWILVRHVKGVHLRVTRITCERCGRTFKWNNSTFASHKTKCEGKT